MDGSETYSPDKIVNEYIYIYIYIYIAFQEKGSAGRVAEISVFLKIGKVTIPIIILFN